MIDKVEAVMREVAAEAVLPRFRRLEASDIEEKGPGDLVTIADREAERLIGPRLTDLVPGSVVVGEEAVSADPSLMSHIADQGAVWLVDPVDGTANFAAGRAPFAMMIALLREGRTVAAWILNLVTGVAAIAELGGGAYLGGAPVTSPRHACPAHLLRGAVSTRYLPPEVRAQVTAAAPLVAEVLPGRNCAGDEYPAIVRDEQQFALFWRMLAWDHAPGVLFIEESGGVAGHLDGTPYDPTTPRFGVLVAQNAEIWRTVRTSLLANVPG